MVLNEFGMAIESVWMELPTRYPNIELDAFRVMPNHIHGIILIVDSPNVGAHELPLRELPLRLHRRRMVIPKIVGYLKMNTAKQINQIRDTPGMPVWQRNYYEHVIRDENELNRIRKYIIENPLQWQLDQENPNRGR
jgi:REP element-mobilizing transposase RayT